MLTAVVNTERIRVTPAAPTVGGKNLRLAAVLGLVGLARPVLAQLVVVAYRTGPARPG